MALAATARSDDALHVSGDGLGGCNWHVLLLRPGGSDAMAALSSDKEPVAASEQALTSLLPYFHSTLARVIPPRRRAANKSVANSKRETLRCSADSAEVDSPH